MSTTTTSPPIRALPLSGSLDRLRTDPAYQGYTLLRIGFAAAPIAFGIDKFFNVMVNWGSTSPRGSTTSARSAPPARCT